MECFSYNCQSHGVMEAHICISYLVKKHPPYQ